MMAYTSHDFTDLTNPTAFTSVFKVNKSTGIKKHVIKNELLKTDAYRLHHPAPSKFQRRRVFRPYSNSIWGMDLVEIKHKKSNYGKSYILTCIDFFDRHAWFEPLKTKRGEEVLNAFKKILDRSGRKPEKITSDHGRELKNQYFTKFCEENNIHQYFTNSPIKCALCERLNRTLFQMIAKYTTFKNTKRFIQHLPIFEDIYNNSYHSSIGMSPSSVTHENHGEVFSRLYRRLPKKTKPKFNKGDTVLRKLDKPLFTKGYSQTFQNEPYTVLEVRETRPPTYLLGNENGSIARAYYEKELLKI